MERTAGAAGSAGQSGAERDGYVDFQAIERPREEAGPGPLGRSTALREVTHPVTLRPPQPRPAPPRRAPQGNSVALHPKSQAVGTAGCHMMALG